MSNFDNDCDFYSDIYKAAYGFRPSVEACQNFASASEEDQTKEVSYLQDVINQSEDDDFRDHLAAIQDYEEAISSLIESAKDRETAIRWILESLDAHDGDEACWLLGLPYYPCKASPSGFAHEFDFYFKGN